MRPAMLPGPVRSLVVVGVAIVVLRATFIASPSSSG